MCTFENLQADFLQCEVCGEVRLERKKRRRSDDTTTCSSQSSSSSPPSSSSSQKQPLSPSSASFSTASTTSRPIGSLLKRLPTQPITVFRNQEKAQAISDEELPLHCPATLVRNALPASLANQLLQIMEMESRQWKQAVWNMDGMPRVASRRSHAYRFYNEAASCTTDAPLASIDGSGLRMSPSKRSLQASLATDSCLQKARQIVEETVRRLRSQAQREKVEWIPSLAVANRYEDGNENVGFHSDFLLDLGPRPIIAGLSLGATRVFRLKRQDMPEPESNIVRSVSLPLPHNSLVIMRDNCQEEWLHAVPKCAEKAVLAHPLSGRSRISLTFRMSRPEFRRAHTILCHCGMVAALKSKHCKYYFYCNPTNKSSCGFWKACKSAEVEAKRLVAFGDIG